MAYSRYPASLGIDSYYVMMCFVNGGVDSYFLIFSILCQVWNVWMLFDSVRVASRLYCGVADALLMVGLIATI